MIDENLAVPFEAAVLGVTVAVERIDITQTDQIVAICSSERHQQSILDLPIPLLVPVGWEWVEAYRLWARISAGRRVPVSR